MKIQESLSRRLHQIQNNHLRVVFLCLMICDVDTISPNRAQHPKSGIVADIRFGVSRHQNKFAQAFSSRPQWLASYFFPCSVVVDTEHEDPGYKRQK